MEVHLLNTAYITEDGCIFECKDLNKFPQVLKTIASSVSSEEAEGILNKKGIPYKRYNISEGKNKNEFNKN